MGVIPFAKQPKPKSTGKVKKVKHSTVRETTKAAASKRADAMERALKAAERGSPGRPPRPAPRVKRVK